MGNDGLIARFERDGFAVASGLIDGRHIADLITACPAVDSAGLRNLLSAAPAFRGLAEDPALRSLVASVLGGPGLLTRAILFDKSPTANWSLPFHQDVVVAVAERADAPGFGPWSIKATVPHVQPPAAVLERMATVRVHLDDCDGSNGPLTVIPGSHRHGLLDDASVRKLVETGPATPVPVRSGDAVLMRPLLPHGSPRARRPRHRRVAHFEFAAEPLPHPLRWREE